MIYVSNPTTLLRVNKAIFNIIDNTSIFILKTGIEIISSSAKVLMDAAPDQKIIDNLENTVIGCDGVLELNWLRCRTIGRGLFVDLAVEVDPDLSVKLGHEIDSDIIKAIHDKFKTVLEVQVQINPG